MLKVNKKQGEQNIITAVECPESDKLNAITDVMNCLRQYDGGIVKMGEHPLWLAVVRLERVSFKVERDAGTKFIMGYGWNGVWCCLLDASRGNNPDDALFFAKHLVDSMQRFIDGKERDSEGKFSDQQLYGNATVNDLMMEYRGISFAT